MTDHDLMVAVVCGSNLFFFTKTSLDTCIKSIMGAGIKMGKIVPLTIGLVVRLPHELTPILKLTTFKYLSSRACSIAVGSAKVKN